MNDTLIIKQKILDFVNAMDETVQLDEAEKLDLKSMCDELAAHTLEPEPINNQKAAEGVWLSRYACFGAKHSSEQPLRHTTSLALQSFGKLPNVPADVHKIVQEIEQATRSYNNVVYVSNEAGDTRGVIVMYGRYSETDGDPQRYAVDFYRVAFYPGGDMPDAQFRDAFGIAADAALDTDLPSPNLYSDIVYVDEDLRINYGKLGGFYVMERLHEPGFSVLRT